MGKIALTWIILRKIMELKVSEYTFNLFMHDYLNYMVWSLWITM